MIRISEPLQRVRDYERERAIGQDMDDRPLFHLTPMTGWMNDPNGFCWYRGQYHLFYQYYPYSCHWGLMHWGHAVSTDLLHWTYLPCALAPDTDADAAGCFSGSAVETPDGRMMLCYTGVQPAGTSGYKTQAQCIAVGDGTDFEKSPLNPVISHMHLPKGYSGSGFRDPKIWRKEDGTYQLVVANLYEERYGTILLMESRNGLDWHFIGEIDASRNEYGKMWECPDFFALDGTQVLLVSPQEMQAREEFHAGHGTVALLGDFDEKQCRFERKHIQPVDHGLNFYAPQTVLAPDGRRIMIGWMDSWDTCGDAPRRHSWYAQMSMPRELCVKNGHMTQQPVREIESLWLDTVSYDRIAVQDETVFSGIQGRLMDLTVRIFPEGSACRRFTLHVAKDQDHYTEILCDPARGELVFDRSHGGSRRDIVHTRRVKAEVQSGSITLRLLMDRESIELFINDGERVVTSLIPTPMEADGITFAADAPVQISVEAHHLG